ncbi:hypothetical protein GLAREA_05928 [Glarea lozoyensis ATCC 20868]|uniref:4-dimethylallyltryptophan N-methyltransferase n=1 Tax=Glarea lozoyensis (strain ATCC 20868 / MF5171) TaxID=1116229 RepID=S3DLJ2_GLAL2|nr:uncharacterized protein GLAREA_05928 [Glarea lozoyensis ATCC 20868]EPE32916.1 hypothetical protein GLAREA_05928 [Glarea lozoyensis ATCC 20868]
MTTHHSTRKRPLILDIRQLDFEDSITKQVIDGLSNKPRTLPALLFYSTEGLKHWNVHSQQAEFYPKHEELRVIKDRAHDIATSIEPNSVIVDLGSASLDKVIPLLEALESQKKNIRYYALDLSAEELASTLQAIPTERFQHVHFAALHGTFEDGLLWLKNTPEICNLPHCLLLLGLTIGNFSRENAAAFLRSIAAHDRPQSRKSGETDSRTSIILTIDSCKTPTKILRAYNAEGVVPFALTALKYANVLLGKEAEQSDQNFPFVFESEEWHFLSQWNHVLGRHEASLVPKNENIKLGAPLDAIVVGKEEAVRFGCSYKYDKDQRRELFAAAGVEEAAVWSHDECDVAFYKLQTCIDSIAYQEV